MDADRPQSLYLVVPPSDLSRTRPLMRLVLNLIARRLTEQLESRGGQPHRRQLLLMLDEFPALGRLDFFETSLAFLAGYGVRAYLIAQSLKQIEKAYGANNAIVDNCHVRIAFAANDERTAKRISDALGTKTELRAQRNLAGKRLSPWLSNTSISEQETSRALLTPGEVVQLRSDEALIFVSGCPPIRARKLRYFEDGNFALRCLPSPRSALPSDRPRRSSHVRVAEIRGTDARLVKQWGDYVTATSSEETGPTRESRRAVAGAATRRAVSGSAPGRRTGSGVRCRRQNPRRQVARHAPAGPIDRRTLRGGTMGFPQSLQFVFSLAQRL
jgi:type IV secretion system protein VirD4